MGNCKSHKDVKEHAKKESKKHNKLPKTSRTARISRTKDTKKEPSTVKNRSQKKKKIFYDNDALDDLAKDIPKFNEGETEYRQTIPPAYRSSCVERPPLLPKQLKPHFMNDKFHDDPSKPMYLPESMKHVTLYHNYARTEDNLLIQATTGRYREKYITTIYYKPKDPKKIFG